MGLIIFEERPPWCAWFVFGAGSVGWDRPVYIRLGQRFRIVVFGGPDTRGLFSLLTSACSTFHQLFVKQISSVSC